VARFGGDEFVILLARVKDVTVAARVAEKIVARMKRPYRLGERDLRVTTSVGVALGPDHGDDAETLMKHADTAMYHAKESGRNAFRFYTQRMNADAQERLDLHSRLRRALERKEFVLHYQPLFDLRSGRIVGGEALVRWQSPEQGLVAPGLFIPAAEHSGLIVPLGEWVLHEACAELAHWHAQGCSQLSMAVNISAIQFRRGDVEETVRRALDATGAQPTSLELELTESILIDGAEQVLATIRRLQGLGVRLAIDDFGTGYSSLSYLKRFPFDILKIDRSFVQNIVTDPDDAVIAVAVIGMAHSLGLQVIAEGVEDESQMRYLRSHLCDEIQGYQFCRPLPAAELAAFLREPRSLVQWAEGSERQERTLLLVDDEPDVLNALKRLLRRSGYRILTAGSAAEGLELLALNSVQVIVSDQRMPNMSGSEFLGRVKILYPDSMRIVLSGYTEVAALTDAINRGAIYKFVTKPWNDDDLRRVIREAFVAHAHKATKPATAKSTGEPA